MHSPSPPDSPLLNFARLPRRAHETLLRAPEFSRRALEALRDWATPRGNPFVAQLRAQESRRAGFARAALLMALLWTPLFLIIWAATQDDARDTAGDAASLWIGIALVGALLTRLTRGASVLRIEVIKNRFEPLQLLPLESAARAWLWCAPVTLPALAVFGLALPAMAWQLGSGRFAWHDVFGLLTLALMCGVGRPQWRPQKWRAQLNKAGSAGMGDGFVAPPTPDGAPSWWMWGALLAVIALGMAGVGLEAPVLYWAGLPAHLRATGAELWLDWPLFIARWLTEAQPFFGFSLAPIVLVLPMWVANMHNGVLRLGAVTALEPYWKAPRLDSWWHRPIRLQLGDGTPTQDAITALEPYWWTAPRLDNWWRARHLQLWLVGALVVGLLWPGAIEGAWLSGWFGAPPTRDAALATAWLVALFAGTMSAGMAFNRLLKEPFERAPLFAHIEGAARAGARELARALAALAVACALGGAWPFGATWRQILPASLAVTLVWLGATLASLAGERIPRWQTAFGWWMRLWFFGGPVLIFALNWFEVDLRSLTPQLYFLSPWGLWWCLRDTSIAAQPLFWPAILVHTSLAIICASIAHRAGKTVVLESDIAAKYRIPQPRPREVEQADAPNPTPQTAPSDALPTQPSEGAAASALELQGKRDSPQSPNVSLPSLNIAPQSPNVSPQSPGDAPQSSDVSPQSLNIAPQSGVDSPQSEDSSTLSPNDSPQAPNRDAPGELDFDDDFDDEADTDDDADASRAVLGRAQLGAPDKWLARILGWQDRFGNPLLRLEVRRVVGNGVADTLGLALGVDGLFAFCVAVALPAWWLYSGAFPVEFLALAMFISLLIWGAVPLNGIEGAVRCYDKDRVDGSLQMLFLTPLTEREIAIGKLGPFLLRAAILWALYSPMWLIGLICSAFLREPFVVAVYLMAPPFVAGFALRIAATSHWTALKKRRIGSVAVPSGVVLSALIAVPAELIALGLGASGGPWGLAAAMLILSLIFVAEAALLWWLSLRQLRHRRFLDAPVGR